MVRNPAYATGFLGFLALLSWSYALSFMPLLAKERLSATLPEAGLIAFAMSFGTSFAALGFGFLSDLLGRSRIIRMGFLVWAVVLFLVRQAGSVAEIIALSATAGAGLAMIESPLFALTADVTKPHMMGRSFGIFTTGVQLGLTVGPLLGGLLILNLGPDTPFTAFALIAIAGVICSWLILPNLERSVSKTGATAAKRGATRLRILSAGLLTVVGRALLVGATLAMVPLYGKSIGLNEASIGGMIALQSIVSAILRVPFGLVIDRVTGGLLAATVSLSAGALAVGVVGYAREALVLAGLILVSGIFLSAPAVAAAVLTSRAAPTQKRGASMGLTSTFRFAGFGLGPLIVSQVASTADMSNSTRFELGFLAVGALALAISVGVMVIVRLERSRA